MSREQAQSRADKPQSGENQAQIRWNQQRNPGLALRTLAILLTLVLTGLLCACGQGQRTAPDGSDSTGQNGVSDSAVQNGAPDSVLQNGAPDSAGQGGESVELIVFAAASMQETLSELAEMYEADHPGVKVVCSFESSGTLKTQIQEGADCDIFLSAGQKQMDQLDAAADAAVNTEELDFVLAGTRLNLLENKVALAVPEGNPAHIESYEDLRDGLVKGTILLAMGNGDVPVGQYTQKILAYYGLSEKELAAAGRITYGSNVKEVTAQVAEAVVDCGIIYQTDAYSAGLDVVDTAAEAMCGQVIYPAAVLNVSRHPEEARAFLDYLTGGAADRVFEAVGFTPIA